MITCYFGVPRVGKNTFLTKIAQREIKRMKKGKSKYKHVYTDFYCKGAEMFKYSDFADYKAYDSLFLIEEMGLDADNRDFKSFSKAERDWFVLHGHFNCDIIYATQDYGNVDKKIRQLTEELWYLRKSCVPLLRQFTTAERIFRSIAINEYTGELVMGYRFATLLERIFTPCYSLCFRPLYYSKFESFGEGSLQFREVLDTAHWDMPCIV